MSVVVRTERELVAILRETALASDEYVDPAPSDRCTLEKVGKFNRSLDKILGWETSLVILGHQPVFSSRRLPHLVSATALEREGEGLGASP